MKRIDRIRAMTVSEMAELILESDCIADDNLDFCPNKCIKKLNTDIPIEKEDCKQCLIRWLMEET